jgi:FkbM family methyltransferase
VCITSSSNFVLAIVVKDRNPEYKAYLQHGSVHGDESVFCRPNISPLCKRVSLMWSGPGEAESTKQRPVETLRDAAELIHEIIHLPSDTGQTASFRIDELKGLARACEEHAYGVRQTMAQRTRLLDIIEILGRISEFKDAQGLAAVLAAIKESRAQFLQDVFALLFARGKRGGYFVEFGACDGLLISNTWLLETKFGWRGILSEPALSWQDRLKRNRACIIDTRCVWAESGQTKTFGEFVGDSYKTESSVLDANSPPTSERYDVQTVSLADLLQQHGAPRHIDFMSIDVEGSEFDILETFPFDKYSFGFLCVEQKDNEPTARLKRVLERAGYAQILATSSGHDGFYVPVQSNALADVGALRRA